METSPRRSSRAATRSRALRRREGAPHPSIAKGSSSSGCPRASCRDGSRTSRSAPEPRALVRRTKSSSRRPPRPPTGRDLRHERGGAAPARSHGVPSVLTQHVGFVPQASRALDAPQLVAAATLGRVARIADRADTDNDAVADWAESSGASSGPRDAERGRAAACLAEERIAGRRAPASGPRSSSPSSPDARREKRLDAFLDAADPSVTRLVAVTDRTTGPGGRDRGSLPPARAVPGPARVASMPSSSPPRGRGSRSRSRRRFSRDCPRRRARPGIRRTSVPATSSRSTPGTRTSGPRSPRCATTRRREAHWPSGPGAGERSRRRRLRERRPRSCTASFSTRRPRVRVRPRRPDGRGGRPRGRRSPSPARRARRARRPRISGTAVVSSSRQGTSSTSTSSSRTFGIAAHHWAAMNVARWL